MRSVTITGKGGERTGYGALLGTEHSTFLLNTQAFVVPQTEEVKPLQAVFSKQQSNLLVVEVRQGPFFFNAYADIEAFGGCERKNIFGRWA